MKIQVLVRLKPGVLDVQGKAVEQGIADLGHREVTNVRIGKLVELQVNERTFEAAKSKVEQLCSQLLTNPIIENFEIIQAKD